MFTPILADFYKVKFEKEFASNFVCHWFLQAEILIIFCKKDLVDQGSRVECIFVSSDRSENEMMQYMAESHADWLAIPWGTQLAG